MPDISVAIVSYNTAGRLRECLYALRATDSVAFETTVVDNASEDGSGDMVAVEFPEIALIRNSLNRGFAAASNQAIANARGRYVLLLNPDTIVPPLALAGMAGFLDLRADAAICGPRLLLADGTLQSCGLPFPTVGSVLRQMRSIDRLVTWVRGPSPDVELPREPFVCDWVEGACLMIRRSTIDRIGPLDERFFLFGDDMDWCRSARAAGQHVFALPGISVMHHRGESTRQREMEALTLLVQMTLTYFQKWRGTGVAALIAMIWAAGFLKQMPGDRARSRAKLLGVRRWIASVGARR